MENMSPQMVVAWLRKKSKELAATADSLEQIFVAGASPGLAALTPPPQRSAPSKAGSLDMGSLKKRLKEKSGRIKDIADEFGVDEGVVQFLVDEPDSGIIVAERGWLKLEEQVISANPKPYGGGDVTLLT